MGACSTGRDRCPLSGAQRRLLDRFSVVCDVLAERSFVSVRFYGGCPLLGRSIMRGSTVNLLVQCTKSTVWNRSRIFICVICSSLFR